MNTNSSQSYTTHVNLMESIWHIYSRTVYFHTHKAERAIINLCRGSRMSHSQTQALLHCPPSLPLKWVLKKAFQKNCSHVPSSPLLPPPSSLPWKGGVCALLSCGTMKGKGRRGKLSCYNSDQTTRQSQIHSVEIAVTSLIPSIVIKTPYLHKL